MENESAMDWVEEFYRLQNHWLQVYMGDIDEHHHKRANLAMELVNRGKPSLDILELGAGGGQTSIALARLGHKLVMIELVDDMVANAKGLAAVFEKEDYRGTVQVIQGDFYKVQLDQKFDVVCYFDSFGIGTDEDQRRLLRRISNWLRPGGCAIIEVGTPWYWGVTARGREMHLGEYIRRYEFDAENCRMLDYWYPQEAPEKAVHQRLRCYSPPDLRLLLEGCGLEFESLRPNGRVDYDREVWVEEATLEECMTYYAKLNKK